MTAELIILVTPHVIQPGRSPANSTRRQYSRRRGSSCHRRRLQRSASLANRETVAGYMVSVCAVVLALSGCGGSSSASTSCGFPPPIPTPIPFWLAYPPTGSTNVGLTIGKLIGVGGVTLSMTTTSGNSVPLGSPTLAPSPYPTPFATAPPNLGLQQYYAVPIPTLSPNTTYTISDSHIAWENNPPSCGTTDTQQVGSFTTGN